MRVLWELLGTNVKILITLVHSAACFLLTLVCYKLRQAKTWVGYGWMYCMDVMKQFQASSKLTWGAIHYTDKNVLRI